MKSFYEVNERGMVVQLNRWACGCSPNGNVVYASSPKEAADLNHRYMNGEYGLKGEVIVMDELDPSGTLVYSEVIR